MLYAATLSESQRVMSWRLILGEFGPNIQNIAGFDNIIFDTLSRLTCTPSNKYKPFTRNSQCRANELFEIVRIENNKDSPPLNLVIVQREQKKEPRNINPELSTYISDQVSG